MNVRYKDSDVFKKFSGKVYVYVTYCTRLIQKINENIFEVETLEQTQIEIWSFQNHSETGSFLCLWKCWTDSNSS